MSSVELYLLIMFVVFCFNVTSSSDIYTLSLHDALPIYCSRHICWTATSKNWNNWRQTGIRATFATWHGCTWWDCESRDRKSTRLNSSHVSISYAVFCLKKKKDEY